MKRRTCLVGAALSVIPLAFGATSASAATKPKPKPKPNKPITVHCSTNVGVMVAVGDTGVTPPVDQGNEYGSASCDKFGAGVQSDSFTVPDTGDTVAAFTWYFKSGTIHGTYDLTPQEGSFTGNFLAVDYLGTLVVAGGTGTYEGVKGTGAMVCSTADGIHTTCTDKLKVKLKPATAAKA